MRSWTIVGCRKRITIQHVVFLALLAQQCYTATDAHRRRLDPTKDASPESNQRITTLIRELRTSQSSDTFLDSQQEISRWTIQLQAPPVWICRMNQSSNEDCQERIQQEQDDLLLELDQLFPTMTVTGKVQHILNAIFVELPLEAEIPSNLPGVKTVGMEEVYTVSQVQPIVLEQVGATFANEYCLTGKGIKVGILDSGVDYTHRAIGGNGTQAAYISAYGSDQNAAENQNRDDLFPTAKVVQGKDFLGESDTVFTEDDDPIDANGHGTAVASAVLSVAPDVELVAVKACITAPAAYCPESALVKGIEFMLDPDQNGSLDNKVRIRKWNHNA